MNILKKLGFFSLILTSTSVYALPNPAAVYCTQQGYQYHLENQTGMCVFKDGSYCEEWAFKNNKCHPGQHWYQKNRIQNKTRQHITQQRVINHR